MRWPSRKVLWRLLQLGLLLMLLSGMMLPPAYGTVRTNVRELIVRVTIKDLSQAIENFKVEHDRYPAPSLESAIDDLATQTAGPLLDCLLGQKVWGNKEGRVYLEDSPIAKDGRNGIAGEPDTYRLLDSWGNTFRVIIDTNRDDRVANPDANNSDHSIRAEAPAMLPTSVIVFSCGPDGLPYTRDDIPSWRHALATPPKLTDILFRPDVLLFFAGISLVLYSIVGLFATAGRTSSP